MISGSGESMSRRKRKKQLRVKNSGYSHYGASRTKPSVSAWYSRSLSPHEDITDNLELLRERSRDLYAGGGPLGRGAIDRIVINSVGAGLTLSCRIDAESLGLSEEEAAQWEDNTEREFSCIALIEGDRLQKPPVRSYTAMIDGGVEFDIDGKPTAYHITNRHPYSEITGQPTLEYVRVPAFGARTGRRNVLHLLPLERIGQHRGVPFLAPVIETLKQLGRYSDAELMAAVIGGMFAIFFEHGVMMTIARGSRQLDAAEVALESFLAVAVPSVA